jgi:phosphomannomutase
MSKIYLFDVDGTLTPAKQKMQADFAAAFLKWAEDKEVYIVSGGSFERILNQVGYDVLHVCAGVFACMGNIFYRPIDSINPPGFDEWEIVYENKFKPPSALYRRLDEIVEASPYHTKTGRHHEERVGMVNFSVVGRNASQAERQEYAEYDADHAERAAIVDKLKTHYRSLDFAIGGAVSIDIFKNGADKSQIIERYFEEAIENNQILFVGDRIPFPGNDYSLAISLQQHPNGAAYEVESWEDTAELLKTEPFA